MSAVESMKRVLGLYMEAVDVIQPSIPGLCDDGQRPPVAFHIGMAVLYLPRDHSVTDDADAMRIRDHYGPVEKAGIFQPGCAGHLPVAVFREPSSEDAVF